MDSLKGTLTPMKVLNGTLNGGIAYGTFNYNELENKPSVNGTELVGNVNIAIPTKTSDLTNDSGFITSANVPTKTSDLTNDSGFITSADIPTKTSELTNDSGFITSADIPTIPTNTSQLNNDSGFLTINTTPVRSVNSQTGDVNLFIPNATSQLTNDAGFITDADVPTKTSDLTNDSGFITSADIPTKTSELTNDSGFFNAQNIAQTGTIEDVAIASFSDGADNVPVSELIVNIKATQEGSGTPSPDNVRAISGFDSGVITRCGKNLYNINNQTTTVHNTYCPMYLPANSDITFSTNIVQTALYAEYYDNGNWVGITQKYNTQTLTFNTGNHNYIRFMTYNTGTQATKFQAEFGTTATTYEAYNGNTYTVDFRQTVYGGSLNVTSGELTITHGYIASYNGETINEPWISSIDEYVPNTSPSTGAKVVYPLSTPTTVQLTPTKVRTLLGNNNIFANTGNINELVYFKTGCEAIAKLIEAMIQ